MNDFLSNSDDMTNNTASQLIGLEISEAIDKLGNKWTCLEKSSSQCTLVRAGVGLIMLIMNGNSIVVQTPTSNILTDEQCFECISNIVFNKLLDNEGTADYSIHDAIYDVSTEYNFDIPADDGKYITLVDNLLRSIEFRLGD